MSDPLRDSLQNSIGSTLLLLRELGGGGMSRVFVARDETLGREVVIKVLSPELARTLSVERFTREIRLAAALQEPHIVPVLAAGETADGLPWYTMPFVRGETLRAALTRGSLPEGEALGMLRNVAQALAYAHAHGIVHRDIKPENVLLSSGTAVVADFGIAKALSASVLGAPNGGTLTSLGTSVGTPAYMAPEQAVGDSNTDHRADVYAWGIMAWEVLAGRHPFADRQSPQALISAHLTIVPAPLGEIVPGLAPEIAALVARAVEKEPEARPASMQEVLNALSAAMGARATPVPERDVASSHAPPRQAAARRPLLIGGVAAVGVVVAAMIWWRQSTATSPSPATGASAASSTIETLAVLPFVNVGGNPQEEYFSDGITDELAHALGRIDGLRLAGRSSSFAYKGKAVPAREIGAALEVKGIIEGTVRRAGPRVRITAQLTSTADGKAIWADSYESTSGDVFQVQDSVTKAIVAALAPRLAKTGATDGGTALGGITTTDARGTTDPRAYDLYLRGRFFLAQRGAAPLAQAIRNFSAALEADATFARAWSSLAQAYLVQPNFDRRVRPAEVFPLAERAVTKALAYDSLLGDAHLARAYLKLRQLQFAAADSSFATVRRLDPRNPLYPHWYAIYLAGMSRGTEALEQMRIAVALDPQSATTVNSEGLVLQLLRRFDEVPGVVSRMIAIDPVFIERVASSTMAYVWIDPDSALYYAEISRTSALPPRGAMGRSVFAAAAAGNWVAYDSLVLAMKRTDPALVNEYDYLLLALTQNRLDEAVRRLESSLYRDGGLGNTSFSPGCEPVYDILKDRADYRALMQRLGIPICETRSPWPITSRPPR